jgi:hypothetical protein
MIILLRVVLFFLSLSILCSPYSDYYKSNYIIAVNPITPLHKLPKDSIFSLRTAWVKEHNLLGIFPKKYIPCLSIYSRIEGDRDWVHDAQFYVCNPYILVAICSGDHVAALLPYCGINSVEYTVGKITETYRGESANRWFYYAYDYYPDSSRYYGSICLMMVNAHDAGFKFAHLDSSRSYNIDMSYPPSERSLVRSIYTPGEFYHVGRYSINNISPFDKNKTVKLLSKNRKTTLYIKLWRDSPATVDAKEDFAYVIIIEP